MTPLLPPGLPAGPCSPPVAVAAGRGAADGPDYSLTVTLPEAGTLCVNLNQNASCDAGSPVSAARPVLTG